MKSSVSRRTFAKTFAGLSAGAAAQFSGLFRDVFAQTAPAAAPLRLLVMTQAHGKSAFWRPRAPGGGAATEASWTLDFDPDSDLGPLQKHKDSLVVIDGLDFYSLYKPGAQGIIGGHVHTPALTGWDCRSEDDTRTKGPSLDVAVASFLKVPPLIYEAGSGLTSFTTTGDTAPAIEDVVQSYKNLFGNLTISPTPMPMADPAVAARRNAEASVLKYLKDEANVLRGRLAGSERVKLEQHLEALGLMESRLGGMTAPLPGGCSKPTLPSLPGYEIDVDKPLKHKVIAEQIAAAFACNLTRVATFHMEIGNHAPFIDLGGATKHVHADVVHVANAANPTDINMRYVARVHRWHATQASYLFDLLKAIPEAGGSVYDHTIVLWTNELGAGFGHTSWEVPFVLAGGGGPWRKGRFLDFPSGSADKGFSAARVNETESHNRLLTSVAKAFGMPGNSFGDPTLPGELPGLV